MKKIATLLIIIGIVFLAIGSYEYINIQIGEKQARAEAEELLNAATNKDGDSKIEFDPAYGDTIGLLKIEKIDASIPIIEGTDPDELERGVGHMSQTAYPGDNDQILLSGHRDTVFTRLGEVELGDIITVELPYGTFKYEMVDSVIVSADDTSIIGSTAPDEELVISTCYPFGYIGSAPDRYVIYAIPIEE
ncbi:class D sortase [Amphibacillus sp. MSJ-3]|uniref:class D sortase n=1 Tax=Amphibacillus sp. MSJ-3 TaxID=2841505 RepID=UPI001C0EDE8D|nr:class D sortase [Amphibacillus sp. MSJ-3]MBU5594098.1 class D sortase [Amphibacillus sp. MSJ-3]